jgi:hypothetical protein
MTIKCAWCGEVLGEKNPSEPGISHGICPACERNLRSVWDQRKERNMLFDQTTCPECYKKSLTLEFLKAECDMDTTIIVPAYCEECGESVTVHYRFVETYSETQDLFYPAETLIEGPGEV